VSKECPKKLLGEIAQVRSGVGFPRNLQGRITGSYPFAKVGDISTKARNGGDEIDDAANYVDVSDLRRLRAKPFPVKTIVFAKIGEAIRQNFRLLTTKEMLFDNNVGGVTANADVIDPYFLLYFLRSVDFYLLSSSTTVPSIKKSTLESIEIPLPPLPQQRRIVARIKEMMERVDEIRKLREEALKEAEAVIEGIRREYLGTFEMMPKGWKECRLDNLSDVIYGISAAIAKNKNPSIGPPIIRMANISLDGHLDLSDLRYCPIPKGKENHFLLRPGDLLLNWRSGSAKHVGKTALFDQTGKFTCASFILRIRAKKERANNRYLRHVLNFMRAEGFFERKARMQINSKLNAQEFASFPIRIPPNLDVQREIAEKLDMAEYLTWALLNKSRELEKLQDQMSTAILTRAFAGEL